MDYVAKCTTCNEQCRTKDHAERADFIYLHRDAGHPVAFWIEAA